jgi:proteasome lid subunit RPN8/RPN11
VRRAIIAHARRERPRECCGFLIGRGNRVQFACPMANVAASPATEYRVDDAAHIELRRVLRNLAPAIGIVGVFHSHPAGPADPSPRDIEEAHYPGWIHIIVGFTSNRSEIRAFRLSGPRPVAMALI